MMQGITRATRVQLDADSCSNLLKTINLRLIDVD